MYLIALCDDEEAELDKTERMLRHYGERHSGAAFAIERFESADDLLDKVREKEYMPDCILMDIYMPGKLGTDVARPQKQTSSTAASLSFNMKRERPVTQANSHHGHIAECDMSVP